MSGIVIDRVVDWQDTDASGHYHHGTVIRWVEAAEAAYLAERGLTQLFGRIPRVRYEVDYLDRLWFGDTVSVRLSLARIGTASLRYEFTVTRVAADRALAARGSLTIVHAPDSGAEPWPEPLAAALGGPPREPFPLSPTHS